MEGIYLRTATMKDCDLLFEWANDKTVRNNAFNMEPIEYGSHCEWYKNIMESSKVQQFIMEKDGMPIGQVRINIVGESAEISYSIAREFRGFGYGTSIIELLVREVKRIYPEVKSLVALVKTRNAASKQVFIDNSFQSEYECYKLEL